MAHFLVTIEGLAPNKCNELVDFLVCEGVTFNRKETSWGDYNIIIAMANNILIMTTKNNIIFFGSNDGKTISRNTFERIEII